MTSLLGREVVELLVIGEVERKGEEGEEEEGEGGKEKEKEGGGRGRKE
ncbi:hypothetical protein TRV_05990 [Trichophyton verrucosum HKI 0517]|uniref:Uncharacterized protein n=1 Tax=Trichophyton verrucosum (strain HKI 0517) TaxID=663202 RepID=D4DFN9_TRIVH|nr:uncharacterized protein TRV_05990 [Trichophyton verrucosum HKI 0517]EFE39320.1 hypothetical protein TRV_05990 [Trichophyton verrucosum HKI 0517]